MLPTTQRPQPRRDLGRQRIAPSIERPDEPIVPIFTLPSHTL